MHPQPLGTTSLWMGEVAPFKREVLRENLSAEVCIIGAGIAGLTAAYFLCKERRNVVVLESGLIGSGQSGRTTAHFVTALDDRYFYLEKYHGAEGARLAAKSHGAAIELVEKIIAKEGIDCDWRRVPGYLFLGPDHDTSYLQKELEALHRAGLTEVEWRKRAPLRGFETGNCLFFPRQAYFQPMKYLKGLTAAIEAMGGKVFTETHVDKIEGGMPALAVTSEHFTVTADSLVVATNVPINDLAVIHMKQAPYRSYVIAGQIPNGTVEPGLYWDTQDSYHYVRTHEGKGDFGYLVIGGEDHKTGQFTHPEVAFERLEKWARKRFPMLQSIKYRWSGQVIEPADGLGYIGRNPMDSPNSYIITGDSGNGMTHGSLGGKLVTDLIVGRESEWEKLYSPSRSSMKAMKRLVKENLNVLSQYKSWIAPASKARVDKLRPGEGTVVREGLSRVAVYKREDGTLHKSSAFCPHMGGVVSWNDVEKTWDCPCHGSRFDCEGQVIEGPAIADLSDWVDHGSLAKKLRDTRENRAKP